MLVGRHVQAEPPLMADSGPLHLPPGQDQPCPTMAYWSASQASLLGAAVLAIMKESSQWPLSRAQTTLADHTGPSYVDQHGCNQNGTSTQLHHPSCLWVASCLHPCGGGVASPCTRATWGILAAPQCLTLGIIQMLLTHCCRLHAAPRGGLLRSHCLVVCPPRMAETHGEGGAAVTQNSLQFAWYWATVPRGCMGMGAEGLCAFCMGSGPAGTFSAIMYLEVLGITTSGARTELAFLSQYWG